MNVDTSSNPSLAGQASGTTWPIKTFKDRDEWIKLLLATDADALSCTAKIVAARVALHHNIETGQCNPSLGLLAAGTGMSDRNVRRMLRELEQKGWMRINQSRGRHSHSFEFLSPTLSAETGLNPDTIVRGCGSNPDDVVRVQEHQPGHAGPGNPDKPGISTRTLLSARKEKRTANRKAKEIDSLQLDLGDEDSGRRSRNPSSDTDADFKEWYRTYPKHAAPAVALKAYRAVITKNLATPEQLLAGAMRYAAERSGQDPRYTKHPSTWLNGGCWADEPATAITTTIDTEGNPVPDRPPNRPPPANAHAARAQMFIDRLKAQQANGGRS